MHAIADTEGLVRDKVISPEQARHIEDRARALMVQMGVSSVLGFGVLAAAGGLIFWLASALAVALVGGLFLVAGGVALLREGEGLRLLANAVCLIGAGMLVGGAALELIQTYEEIAGWAMAGGGAGLAVLCGWGVFAGQPRMRFAAGAVMVMGLALHLAGIFFLIQKNDVSGIWVSLFFLYAFVVMVGAGWLTNVRLLTALAIVPFAQALDTGTGYSFAVYAFFSPESTLSILQMSCLAGLCLLAAAHWAERHARHARVLAVLALIVANLCALVGTHWGDVVGQTIWGPEDRFASGMSYQDWQTAMAAFKTSSLVLSAQTYAVAWAAALVALIGWGAIKGQRSVLNLGLSFAALHAYTQVFLSFEASPLAFVICGLAALPMGWGIWRVNTWMSPRQTPFAFG